MKARTLSSHAHSVLKALVDGAPVSPLPNGFRIGRKQVPFALADELVRQDLVLRTEQGLQISEPGKRLVRRVAPPAPGVARGEAIDSFRGQHFQLGRAVREMPDGERSAALVNHTESPLGWLVRRRGKDGKPLLSHRQFDAGERLREDFERASLGSRVTASWSPLPVERRRSGPRPSGSGESGALSRERVQLALGHVGPGLSDILIRTCCHLEGLEDAERGLGWPARSAKLVLAIALDRLADHYEGKR